MSAQQAAAEHGATVARGGLWFPQGGWVAPPDVCRAQLAMAGEAVETRFGCRIASLHRTGDGWQVSDEAGQPVAEAP
ncbi:hypothetical protein O6205_23450, partial [Salmonella enterica subsp. enterica]